MRIGSRPHSSSILLTTWMRQQVRNAQHIGLAMCAVSVQMKFLPEAGEVESTITSRTRTYLEGKPEEDNSMSLKRRTEEGMYTAAPQVLCAWLDWDCQT